MVSFTFSAEQVKAAPPEVRRWMEGQIVQALSAPAQAGAARPVETPHPLEAKLAAATAEEMRATFELVAGNSIVARVFFELGRDVAAAAPSKPFHVVNLNEVMRHLQLAEPRQIFACLNLITQAFQQIHRDSETSLFAFDEAGHIFLHEATFRSIREVWQQLVMAHPWPASGHMAQPFSAAAIPGGGPVVPAEPQMRPEYAFAGTSTD